LDRGRVAPDPLAPINTPSPGGKGGAKKPKGHHREKRTRLKDKRNEREEKQERTEKGNRSIKKEKEKKDKSKQKQTRRREKQRLVSLHREEEELFLAANHRLPPQHRHRE
jgi:hypothetical protein